MIAVEWRKQALRLRTYVIVAGMAVLPAVLTVAVRLHPGGPDRGDRGFLAIATHSGLEVPLAALTVMSPFLLVVAVSTFGGETVAGEASWGTLRYLLVRPVSRPRLLAAKAAVAAALSLGATVVVVLAALAAGTAAFGWHPVLTLSLETVSQGAAIARLALATGYVAWQMASYLAFALLVSTLTDSSFAAVASGIGLAIVSQILDGVAPLGILRYALPSHYLNAWHGLFSVPVTSADMVRGVLVQLGYAAVFFGLAWWWFARKDVTS